MAEHPNAVMARQMADALSRGDMQALAGVPCRPAEGHGSPDDTTSDHYPDADASEALNAAPCIRRFIGV